ncbi:hypothetical protein Tco_0844993 [Tanacetum coccineum]
METQKPLLKDENGEEVDIHMYRSLIGSLMYLTSSRPDIMFAVYACARYQVNPKVSHLHAVKRIFRYLKGQPTLGLWYLKDSPFDLVAYTNSDYNGASLDRKSIIGGCQFLGCRLISWQCKKQIVVVNSTTEAEYVVASSCCGQDKQKKSVRLMMDLLFRMELELMLVPKPGAPTYIVVDEVVYKELDDRLVRAATTASSLEAEQDSGSRPRFQETIRDTIAQTRFENVSTQSYDPLLVRMIPKRRKINDTDQDITLVGYDEEMFDVGTLTGDEIKSTKPKVKGIVIQEPECDDIQEKMDADYLLAQRLQAKKQEQFTIIEKATLFKELLEQRRKHFAAKRAEEKMNKPPTQA